MTMKQIWKRIEVWFSIHKEGEFFFFPGATKGQIDLAEQTLKVRLPKDAKESYLIHDGMMELSFYEDFYLLSLERMLDVWQSHNSAHLEYLMQIPVD